MIMKPKRPMDITRIDDTSGLGIPSKAELGYDNTIKYQWKGSRHLSIGRVLEPLDFIEYANVKQNKYAKNYVNIYGVAEIDRSKANYKKEIKSNFNIADEFRSLAGSWYATVGDKIYIPNYSALISVEYFDHKDMKFKAVGWYYPGSKTSPPRIGITLVLMTQEHGKIRSTITSTRVSQLTKFFTEYTKGEKMVSGRTTGTKPYYNIQIHESMNWLERLYFNVMKKCITIIRTYAQTQGQWLNDGRFGKEHIRKWQEWLFGSNKFEMTPEIKNFLDIWV